MKKFFFILSFVVMPVSYAQTSTMTVYVYPPSGDLDWSTPGALLGSFMTGLAQHVATRNNNVDVFSDFKERGNISSSYFSMMGHTIAHIACDLPGKSPYNKWVSFSGQDFREVEERLIFQDKVGFRALYHAFIDGHLISGEENWKRLVHYSGPYGLKPRYLQFQINKIDCRRLADMVEFFESFHFPAGTTLEELSARKPEDILYFSAIHDPYKSYLERKETGKGEVGGGCAPFGAALIKMIGQYPDFWDTYFKRSVKISDRLIGGVVDPQNGNIRKVSWGDLLFGSEGGAWEHQGYVTRDFSLYDPRKIYDFVGVLQECAQGKSCPEDVSHWLKSSTVSLSLGPTLRIESGFWQEIVDGNKSPRPGRKRKMYVKHSVDMDGVRLY